MLRKRVPARLRAAALAAGHKSDTIKFSSGTKDEKAAERTLPTLMQRWEAQLKEWERQADAVALTPERAVEIAAGWTTWIASGGKLETDGVTANDFADFSLGAAIRLEHHANEALQVAGLTITPATRPLLLAAMHAPVRAAYERDWRERDRERVEAFIARAGLPVAAAVPATPGSVTIDALVRGWGRDNGYDPDAKPVARNFYDRDRTAKRLAAFLGHDDAGAVTKADAIRWKESMQGRSLNTIANDISEMSAIWRWAVANGKAADNPFQGILPPKKARTSRKQARRGFTDAEAVQILQAARAEPGALRWLPWVLAATGARLTEVCQAVREDVVLGAHPYLRIHTDGDDDREDGEAARAVKNASSVRNVPLHPRLIAEGFLDYVAALPAGGPLWPDIRPDAVFGSRGQAATKLVSRWLRNDVKITDDRISPAHSWRHWFITRARECEMHPEVRDALTGHSGGRNEAHRYGTGWREMPDRLAAAVARIRFPDGLYG